MADLDGWDLQVRFFPAFNQSLCAVRTGLV